MPVPLPEPRGERRKAASLAEVRTLVARAAGAAGAVGAADAAEADAAGGDDSEGLRPTSSHSGFARPGGVPRAADADAMGLGPFSDVAGPADDDADGDDGAGDDLLIADEAVADAERDGLDASALDGGASLASLGGADFSVVGGESSIFDGGSVG